MGVEPAVRLFEDKRALSRFVEHVGENDVVVWAGVALHPRRDQFETVRRRGGVVIYYQTETEIFRRSMEGVACTDYRQFDGVIDELWDFSRANVDECANATTATVRYVPLT